MLSSFAPVFHEADYRFFDFSNIHYTIGKDRVRFGGSGRAYGKVASPYYLNPINQYTYIGVNRRYATLTSAGSGVCRMRCTTSTGLGLSVTSGDGEVVTEPTLVE